VVWTDAQLSSLVAAFQAEITGWAQRHFGVEQLPWRTFDGYMDARPWPDPVVTVLPLTEAYGEVMAHLSTNEAAVND
jgi:hypothetical protein